MKTPSRSIPSQVNFIISFLDIILEFLSVCKQIQYICMAYLKGCLENKLLIRLICVNMPSELITPNIVEYSIFFSGGYIKGLFIRACKNRGSVTLVKLLMVISKLVECLVLYSSLSSYVQMRN